MANFLPYSWRVILGGLLRVVFEWVFFSALLSLLLVISDQVLYQVGIAAKSPGLNVTTTPSSSDILSTFTTIHLENLDQFKYLGYYQILWAGIILVVAVGSLIYAISLAQKEEGELNIVDYYGAVATPAVRWIGAGLAIWVVSFLVYGIFFAPNYGLFITNSQLATIYTQGRQGLTFMGINILPLLDWVFDTLYKYIPMLFFVAGYVYIIRNAHTGWVGNAVRVPRT